MSCSQQYKQASQSAIENLRHLSLSIYVWTMPETSNQIPVNKEEVRLAVLELGYGKASEKLGIKPGTLRQWASRFAWNVTRQHSQETVTTVTKPVDAIVSEIARLEGETRTSLARSAAQLARQGENAKLEASGHVRNAAQVAQIAFKWRDDEKPTHFTLNQLNINTLAIDQPPTLDG